MGIIRTMNKEAFINEFVKVREGFSRPALECMFEYYEDLSKSVWESVEFDPIAMAWERDEYDTLEEVLENYNDIKEDTKDLFDENDDEEVKEELIIDKIQNYTDILKINNWEDGYLLRAF